MRAASTRELSRPLQTRERHNEDERRKLPDVGYANREEGEGCCQPATLASRPNGASHVLIGPALVSNM